MTRYAAFLRGVNLGASRKVSGAELVSQLEELGFEDVHSFRTSGNAVFTAGRESEKKLIERIEAGLAKRFGFEVVVFLRSEVEMRALAAREPFEAEVVNASKGKLQVSLLGAKPTANVRKDVLALATDEDRLEFGERELFWLPSGGTQDSSLNLNAVNKLLGVTTMRTKGTIDALWAKYFAD